MVWNHVGFWFDSVFYGDYRHQEVERPTFIVGHARSGTNWAHRVLAEDDVHFTAPQLWEMFLHNQSPGACYFSRLLL